MFAVVINNTLINSEEDKVLYLTKWISLNISSADATFAYYLMYNLFDVCGSGVVFSMHIKTWFLNLVISLCNIWMSRIFWSGTMFKYKFLLKNDHSGCGIYVYNGILFSHKKEWIFAICSNTDGLGGRYAKRNKSDRERQILYDLTYVESRKYNKQVNITKMKQTHR